MQYCVMLWKLYLWFYVDQKSLKTERLDLEEANFALSVHNMATL